jgi:hypothetical protein
MFSLSSPSWLAPHTEHKIRERVEMRPWELVRPGAAAARPAAPLAGTSTVLRSMKPVVRRGLPPQGEAACRGAARGGTRALPEPKWLQLDTPNLRHYGYNWIRPTCVCFCVCSSFVFVVLQLCFCASSACVYASPQCVVQFVRFSPNSSRSTFAATISRISLSANPRARPPTGALISPHAHVPWPLLGESAATPELGPQRVRSSPLTLMRRDRC